MLEGHGMFSRYIKTKGYRLAAQAIVKVDQDASEPYVRLECSGEGWIAQGCLEEVSAQGYDHWKDGAVAGAKWALNCCQHPGYGVVVTTIVGMITDTNPTVVGVATAMAVWKALGYEPTAKELARLEGLVRNSKLDEVPRFDQMPSGRKDVLAFRTVFPQRHVVLPVIHVESEAQAVANAEIAKEAGADGVFLINHSMSWEQLLCICCCVYARFDDLWTGVNCLSLCPEAVFREVPFSANGVWTDNAGIDEMSEQQTEAERIVAARKKSGWEGLYFGGVAFKYQRSVDDLARAALVASEYMDVVTTSGPGTGSAASVEKIRTMKEALGDYPLAIASGITPENVGDYLDCADCFLVATGISRSFEELCPTRTRELVERVRACR